MTTIENNELNEEVEILDEEKDNLLEHEFDGIREFNNPAPPWLMWLFYATIFFSAYYWFNMHVFKKGLHQDERYDREMAKAAAVAEKETSKSENTHKLEFLKDKESIAAGNELFKAKICITCHGEFLEGKPALGPNLTDEYWIHGNTIDAIIKIITEGNIQKGMTPYKDQLSMEEMVQLASFIWSKQGSNPANAKEPEGNKY